MNDLKNYFRFAHRLKSAIEVNRADTEFAARSRRIIYIVDTNIAHAYLKGSGRQLAESGLHNLMSSAAASTSEHLTIKYIMSGSLPGQMLRGETVPAQMIQPHWDELMEVTGRLVTDVETDAATLPPLNEADVRALEAVQADPAELMARAKQLGLQKLIAVVRQASVLRNRMQLAFQASPPKLRPIEYLSDYWSAAANRVRASDYRSWTSALTTARQNAGLSINIASDAQALSIIQALYRENPDALGDHADFRFLFITADQAIVEAVAQRKDALASEGIPDFVRTPLVFNPLINFSAMLRADAVGTTDEQVKEIFSDVEQAVKLLFPYGAAPDDQERRWATHWELVETLQRWGDAAEQIALVNSNLFMEGNQEAEIARQIASIFSGNDVLSEVTNSVRAMMSSIKDEHARTMSAVTLSHLIKTLRGDPRPGRRAPTKLVGVDVLANMRDSLNEHRGSLHTPDDLLDLISDRSLEPEQLDSILERVTGVLRSAWDEPATQLLASAIYLSADSWASAADCARRCLRSLGPSDTNRTICREANYCMALSLRMMLRDANAVREASDALAMNLRMSRNEPLVALRDDVELSTLLLTACVVQALQSFCSQGDARHAPEPLIGTHPIFVRFDEAVGLLDAALRTLTENFLGLTAKPELVRGIVLQAAVNRLAAELFLHYLGDRMSRRQATLPAVLREMEDILAEVQPEHVALPPVAEVYRELARYETAAVPDTASALRAIDQASRSAGATEADLAEFEFLRSRLLGRAGLPQASPAG